MTGTAIGGTLRHQTPILEDSTKGGKGKYWQGFVVETADHLVFTYSEFWQDGSVKQQAAWTEVKGKNIGKKSETSPLDQAISEINSDRAKKEKKGYLAQGAVRTRVLPLPMLAHDYTKVPHRMKFPCDVQPKLDGLRCVTDGVQFWSREGNLFSGVNMDYAGLKGHTDGKLLDGELMLPGLFGYDFVFEDIISAVKSKYEPVMKRPLNPRTKDLVFCVFDVLDTTGTLTWAQRYEWLKSHLRVAAHPKWLLVEARRIDTKMEAEPARDDYLEKGFEGVMLRAPDALYEVGERSAGLMKFKDMIEEDFPIIGAKEGEGKDKGTPIWLVQLENGKTSEARSKGRLDARQDLWKHRESIIANRTKVTVIYQGRTADGKLRFPRAKALRNYE